MGVGGVEPHTRVRVDVLLTAQLSLFLTFNLRHEDVLGILQHLKPKENKR